MMESFVEIASRVRGRAYLKKNICKYRAALSKGVWSTGTANVLRKYFGRDVSRQEIVALDNGVILRIPGIGLGRCLEIEGVRGFLNGQH